MLEAEKPLQIWINDFSLPIGEIQRRHFAAFKVLLHFLLHKVFHGGVWPCKTPFLLHFGWPCWPRISKMILQLLFFCGCNFFKIAILLPVESLPLAHDCPAGLDWCCAAKEGQLIVLQSVA